jgi:hypothetical protein
MKPGVPGSRYPYRIRPEAPPYNDFANTEEPEVASFVLKTPYILSEFVPMKLVEEVPSRYVLFAAVNVIVF